MIVLDNLNEISGKGYGQGYHGLSDWLDFGKEVVKTVPAVSKAWSAPATVEAAGKAAQLKVSEEIKLASTVAGENRKSMEHQFAENAKQREHELKMLQAVLADKAMSRSTASNVYYRDHAAFIDDKSVAYRKEVAALEAQRRALAAGGLPERQITAEQMFMTAVAPPKKKMTAANWAWLAAGALLLGGGYYYIKKSK